MEPTPGSYQTNQVGYFETLPDFHLVGLYLVGSFSPDDV